MKIAFIGQKGVPVTQGGIEKHVQEVATRLVKSGHEVLVYARPHYVNKMVGEYHLVNGVLRKRGAGPRVLVLPSIHTKHLDTISHTFLAILHATWADVDIMHFQGHGPSLLIWLPKLLWPKIKIVATSQGIDGLHQKWGPVARFMLQLGERLMYLVADEVICVSKNLQQGVVKMFGRESHYIPNGVTVTAVSAREQKNILRRFGLTQGKYVLMVSRLVRHKGAHDLLRAFQKLGKRVSGYDLVFVGAAAFTDDYVKELRVLAGADKQVRFLGIQTGKQLSALYRGARVAVQPSNHEGLSLVVLEAIAQAPRVLISDIAENKEAGGGLVPTFRCENVSDLATQLFKQLRPSASMLTSETRRQLLASYQWTGITKQIAKLYRELLQQRKTVPLTVASPVVFHG